MKHIVSLTLKIKRGKSHLDSHTDFTSIWLCSEIIHHYIRNIDSPILKYNEFLVSHHDDLRSKGYLYLYLSWATLDSRVLHSWLKFSVNVLLYFTCMPYQYLYTPWLWGQPTHMTHNNLYLINIIILIIMYHLIMNNI